MDTALGVFKTRDLGVGRGGGAYCLRSKAWRRDRDLCQGFEGMSHPGISRDQALILLFFMETIRCHWSHHRHNWHLYLEVESTELERASLPFRHRGPGAQSLGRKMEMQARDWAGVAVGSGIDLPETRARKERYAGAT